MMPSERSPASASRAVSAYVAFGSNVGDRPAWIREACRRLRKAPGIDSVRLSTIRETEPVGSVEHPAPGGPYLNAVAEVATRLGAVELVWLCLEIERQLGRSRAARNAPRTIDLDVLIHGETVLQRPALEGVPAVSVPHPRMLEREFVLEPLAELAPELVHPVSGKKITEHLREVRATDDSHR